jgi:hypothetical protein
VVVSQSAFVIGVPDRGLDPAVVAIVDGAGDMCTGVLLAEDVVLTARSCVSSDPEENRCSSLVLPPPAAVDPSTLVVYTEVPAPGVVPASSGAVVLTANDSTLCGGDLAILVLARPVEGATPTVASESGIAEGDTVRTVTFGWPPSRSPPESELLREHLPVLDVSPSEFAVAEATCVGSPGGAAIDETTGEVVGVMSRWGSACNAPAQFDVFTRADAFYSLIQDSLLWAPSLAIAEVDGGAEALRDAGKPRAAKAKKPATDLGAACSIGADCGTGVCVTAQGSQYCSELCDATYRCPTDFRCVIAQGGSSVCVESSSTS